MKKDVNPGDYDEMLDTLNTAKNDLYPIIHNDKRLLKAYQRIWDAIDILKSCESDFSIPIKNLKRYVSYAIADLDNHLEYFDEHDIVDSRADGVAYDLSNMLKWEVFENGC